MNGRNWGSFARKEPHVPLLRPGGRATGGAPRRGRSRAFREPAGAVPEAPPGRAADSDARKKYRPRLEIGPCRPIISSRRGRVLITFLGQKHHLSVSLRSVNHEDSSSS